MSGGWNSTGMTGGKRCNIWHVGRIQSDYGCPRAPGLDGVVNTFHFSVE